LINQIIKIVDEEIIKTSEEAVKEATIPILIDNEILKLQLEEITNKYNINKLIVIGGVLLGVIGGFLIGYFVGSI